MRMNRKLEYILPVARDVPSSLDLVLSPYNTGNTGYRLPTA